MKTFIEIGTCDFDTNLPLLESGNWRGVMVEASPPMFDSIAKKVAESGYSHNATLKNVAISDFDGKIDFAVSKPMVGWQRGIGTVINENHTGTSLYHLENNAELVYDEVIEVPCITLDTLMTEYNSIDYLKLDTEGHELTILQNYSWRVKPTFIKLEHAHIDDLAMRALLESQGYMVYTEDQDMYAII